VAAKLLLGYYRDTSAFDLALGTAYHYFTRTDPVNGDVYRIRAFAGLFELGGRYRLLPQLYLGPVLSLQLGEDLSFREASNTSATPTSSQTLLLLAGLQALYDLSDSSFSFQLGLRASTDVNISSRQLFLIQGVVQIGLPLLEGNRRQAEPPTPPATTAPPPVAPRPAVEKKTVTTEVDLGKIRFRRGSAMLVSKSRAYLKAVGKLLAAKTETWNTLSVEGHTDRTGRAAFNVKLSQDRADAVKRALVEGGASEAKIETKGFGPSVPLDPADNEKAYARNRRVEFKFLGLPIPVGLQGAIKRLRSR
jgi:outer membrane protein OmpA-like peptidoglycan-associated protein